MTVDPIWFLIIVIVVLVGFSAGILFYLEKTKDKRVSKARKNAGLNPEDEAYNKVKSTKSITNVMKRRGKNTTDAEMMIQRAEMALKSGNYSRASSLADEAKSKLEKVTDASRGNVEDVGRTVKRDDESKMKKAYTMDEIEELEANQNSIEVETKSEELRKQKEKIHNLPENYLESKFEIQQASDMLKKEGGDSEAKELLEKAKISFDAENYTEALRLSLKCKKTIDEDKAGLIKVQKIGKKESISEETDGSQTSNEMKKETVIKKIDKEKQVTDKTEEDRIYNPTCPKCGYLGEGGDKFCPKCGNEMIKSYTCPSCGNEVDEEDNFCPKCGQKLPSTIYECPECGKEVDENIRFCPSCGVEFA